MWRFACIFQKNKTGYANLGCLYRHLSQGYLCLSICLLTLLTALHKIWANMGILAVTIQKTGANMQSPKRRGKRAVRGQNEGSYAIDPFKYVTFVGGGLLVCV